MEIATIADKCITRVSRLCIFFFNDTIFIPNEITKTHFIVHIYILKIDNKLIYV